VVSADGPGQMTAEEPLTTKEGWRRFADRQTAMPGLPGPSGTGKTTALTQLGRTHERHVRRRLPRTITGCRSST
jgi:hypothetical protein